MLHSLDVFSVHVSSKTTWIFFRLNDTEGMSGLGEATLNTDGDAIMASLPEAIDECNRIGLGLSAKLDRVKNAIPDVVGRAITSALEQGWLDYLGKKAGCPVYVLLGGLRRVSIPTYANINRGTHTREPEEFAQRAQAAVSAGYKAIKLAPFDDITPLPKTSADAENERIALFQKSLDRITAVANHLNGSARLQVDCHSRLRFDEAFETIDKLAELNVSWLEEPVKETPDALDAIAEIRNYASSKDIQLAGAEKAADLAAVEDVINAGCYDVVMPDIIRAGGPTEVMRMGHFANGKNCEVSLHNPSGPVMDVFSAHTAAALPNLHSLERQYDESHLYDEIIQRAHVFTAGEYHLTDAFGAGCSLVCTHPNVEHVTTLALRI